MGGRRLRTKPAWGLWAFYPRVTVNFQLSRPYYGTGSGPTHLHRALRIIPEQNWRFLQGGQRTFHCRGSDPAGLGPSPRKALPMTELGSGTERCMPPAASGGRGSRCLRGRPGGEGDKWERTPPASRPLPGGRRPPLGGGDGKEGSVYSSPCFSSSAGAAECLRGVRFRSSVSVAKYRSPKMDR